MKNSILNLTSSDIHAWFKYLGHPKFHADQLLQWIYHHHVSSFDEMLNLSKKLREELKESFEFPKPVIEARQQSEGDNTEKILIRLPDGEGVETVRIPHFNEKVQTDPKSGKIKQNREAKPDSFTLCLSTQAGCLFACRFCASGQKGLTRNLTAGEIVLQVLAYAQQGHPISRIVFMGTGEPLNNLDELRRAVDILTDEKAFGLSHRRITVSTVGLVPEIYRLAKEEWKTKLAVSLHATTDEKRAELMPLARGYQLDQLKDALRFYHRSNKRRITFEYLMMQEVNDSKADAARLAQLCEGMTCLVNLIPFNPVERTPYRPSTPERINQFRTMLRKRGIDATTRFSRGRTIDAACGQLRLRHAES